MRTIAVLFLLLASVYSHAETPQVSIAPYYHGCRAALSLTFDDGLLDQYTLAFPQLRQRGLKATFAVIGSKVGGIIRSKQDRLDGVDGTPCMTWAMLRELAVDGQEIASHGWEHRAVTRLSPEALRHEVEANDSAIAANIPAAMGKGGLRPRSYFFPGNNKTPETIVFVEQGRVACRTFQTSVGSKRTAPFLRQYADDLIADGEWGVTMTHGISRGYDHFQDPQVFWDFLDYICTKQQQLWIATFSDVAAYVKERDHTTLRVKQTARGLTVTPATRLDKAIYCHPLTLSTHAPIASATQDGRQLTVIHKGDSTLIDFNPHGGKIVIKFIMHNS